MADVNRPSIKNFKKDIRNLKQDADTETYYFDRKISFRNKIIDSIGLLKKDRFLIIDSNTDSNGQRLESSHFFFENKIIAVSFERKDSISNGSVFSKFIPEIKEVSQEYLSKNLYDINYIYESLSSNEIPLTLKGGSERTSYLVTVVKNKRVNYYSVSGASDYKVAKIN